MNPTALLPLQTRILIALAAVYLIWGSTYIAIRFAIETIPPFLMGGARFAAAGAILYAAARLAGAKKPRRIHWGTTTVIGGLLIACGNGGVVWAEQRVPSGLASLLVATVPVWMVLLDWARPEGRRPSSWVMTGLGLGFAGLALLVGPQGLSGDGRINPVGAAVLISGSIAWAGGSVYSLRAPLPDSRLLATAMEMLTGGGLMFLAGLLTGEGTGFQLSAVSLRSAVSFVYLIIFGSLVGFTAYIWLLNATTPARASTYAYVNPVVAVFLGWFLAGEPLTMRTVLAAAVIISAVAVITTDRARQVKQL